MNIVLATRNVDKVREISAILSTITVELSGLERFGDVPEVVEDGDTLEHNAIKKAQEVLGHTGWCALADDTGLEVDALDGAPGVYSSRYAGDGATYEDNCVKLIGALDGVPESERTARFRCKMALALTDDAGSTVKVRMAEAGQNVRPNTTGDGGMVLVTEGIIEGRITQTPRGRDGFGYDPVFEVTSCGQTLAEMGPDEKNQISHRYRALVELRELLLRWGFAREKGSTS